jgi:hypothetical protein
MIAGAGSPGWRSPGGAPPLRFRFHCSTCDVAWTGEGECWMCGQIQKPARVLEVVQRG